jgi:drug/metabolite transporter (DMT)-like permease
MAKADIAALFALGAAFFIAIGDVIHQRSAHEVTDEPVSHLELFKRLLRDGQWWLGSLVAAVGFALQAVALGLGSVLLVQALLVTSLLFALPINARASHRRVTRWEWMWAALLAAAVVVIVTVGNPTAGHSRASLDTWTAVVVVLGPALVACVLGANVLKGPASAVLLGVVSGALWGLFAVLTKGGVDRLDDGLLALARTPELYVWALVAIAGTAYQQGRFPDGVAADDDGHRAGGGIRARHRRAWRDAAPRRRGLADAVRRRGGDGGRDGGPGPRRGDGLRQAAGLTVSLVAC